MENNYVLTQEGKEKLEQELHFLETEKRAEIGDRIRVAREFGDISENSEYDDAKNEQAANEVRIAEITRILGEATIVEAPTESGRVNIGSRVTGRYGWPRARIHHCWWRRGKLRRGQDFQRISRRRCPFWAISRAKL